MRNKHIVVLTAGTLLTVALFGFWTVRASGPSTTYAYVTAVYASHTLKKPTGLFMGGQF